MRVWIDPLTPKQALFFAPLYELLLEAEHDVFVTTREYREAEQVLRLKRVKYTVAGRHGGGSRVGKVVASGERVAILGSLINRWRPDVAVSFSSPEAARVAFGLGVPHVAVNDSPHAWAVAKLALPLSRFVCSPWIVPKAAWVSLGAARGSVVHYKALDPAAWLKRFSPDPRILGRLGLETSRPIVVLRTEEAFAAYLMGKASDTAPVVEPIVKELLKKDLDAQIVVSTRYGRQAPVLRKSFGNRITVLDRVVDASSLLNRASFFVGSGGTMTVESVLLGTPAVSCFPGPKPLYIQYLERRGLVETMRSPRLIASRVQEAIYNPENFETKKQRGKALLGWMEDPVRRILKSVREATR